jgi:hypothetical protein
MGAYVPAIRKTYFEILKKLTKKFTLMPQHSMWARQVLQKIDIFYGLCKKDRQCLIQSYF